jgi:hypothetical protein
MRVATLCRALPSREQTNSVRLLTSSFNAILHLVLVSEARMFSSDESVSPPFSVLGPTGHMLHVFRLLSPTSERADVKIGH